MGEKNEERKTQKLKKIGSSRKQEGEGKSTSRKMNIKKIVEPAYLFSQSHSLSHSLTHSPTHCQPSTTDNQLSSSFPFSFFVVLSNEKNRKSIAQMPLATK